MIISLEKSIMLGNICTWYIEDVLSFLHTSSGYTEIRTAEFTVYVPTLLIIAIFEGD